MILRRVALVVIGSGLIVSCASHGPVVYPNAHYQEVGKEAAERDIAECRALAKAAGAREGEGAAGRVAGRTAAGAATGAVGGAVGGAIVGAAGRGSAIGAASGAAAGLFSGLLSLFSGRSQPNPAYTGFVDRCLAERGYEVTGWQ